ncbi:MAG: hypothetical protein MH472_13390, partial [Bacteroidia bacterium]|nr:hypothetical protein [Bacteroidia bacterium]
MEIQLTAQNKVLSGESQLILLNDDKEIKNHGFSKDELAYIAKKRKKKESYILLNQLTHITFVQFTSEWSTKTEAEVLENYRTLGNKICTALNAHNYETVCIGKASKEEYSLAIAEGLALSNYQFLKYKSDQTGKNTLTKIAII